MDSGSLEGEIQKITDLLSNRTDIAAKELRDKHEDVNYSQIVAGNRLMLLADVHTNRSIKEHVASHAQAMKDAGITHYAIEAAEEGNAAFNQLNDGKGVDLQDVSAGPGGDEYRVVVRAMANVGIKVVAVDINQHTDGDRASSEEREARMAANLSMILKDPEVKVAYLVGAHHSDKEIIEDGVKSTRKRLTDAGVPIVTVAFEGGDSNNATNFAKAAEKIGIAGNTFMLDNRPYINSKLVSFGHRNADYIINLPQRFQAGQERSNTRMTRWQLSPIRNRTSKPLR